MRDEYDLRMDFWTQKLQEYEKQFCLMDYPAKKTDTDKDMQYISDKLKELYGEKNVAYNKTNINPFTNKKLRVAEYAIILTIQKQEFEQIQVGVSNTCVSLRCPTAFVITIRNHGSGTHFSSKHIWCQSNHRDDIIGLFDKICADYEMNMNEFQAALWKFRKEQKIHQLAQTSIRTVVSAILLQTNHEWNLTEEASRSVLQIKMRHGMMMEISLGHKSFTKKIPEMKTVIEQMEQLLDEIPYPVTIRRYGNNINWKKK